MGISQIAQDRVGFPKNGAFILNRRDHAIGIERQILRGEPERAAHVDPPVG